MMMMMMMTKLIMMKDGGDCHEHNMIKLHMIVLMNTIDDKDKNY